VAVARRRDEASRGERNLARQLREMYMLGRSEEVGWMLALEEPANVLRGMAYLDALAARQSDALEDLRRARAAVESEESSLRGQVEGFSTLEKRELARSAELEGSRSRAADLLAGIRTQKETHLQAIEEMTAAAERLEAAIVAGTQDESLLPSLDIGRLRGAIAWPVAGTVVVGFGDRRHPRFGTTTPHPGLELEVAPHAPIRAVLGGRVVFARRFEGYGNTVLLDHGGGHLTVYARAAALNVTEGQMVAQEDLLGTSGQFGRDGGPPTIYFEIRQAGKAVDPLLWLKRKTTHRREG
jgi:septal ring factor EnvC (AmiA/AmiB activator)